MAKKLLLADDSQTIHRVLELTFADEDFEIISAFSGNEAIKKVKEAKPDLVIADVNMPDKDGYQVCQYVKNDPELANIPVILLKGTFEPFDEAKANACQYDGIIAKPFQTKNIINTVKEILASLQPSDEISLEETVEEAPPELITEEAAPQPPEREREIVIPEKQPVVTEEAAAPIEEAPILTETEGIEEAVEGVPELESLTEEEILGLEEPSESEIVLEDVAPLKEEEAAVKEEEVVLEEAIPETETTEREEEIVLEEGIIEEPAAPSEEVIQEEPIVTEPIKITEEESLMEEEALAPEAPPLEEQKIFANEEEYKAPAAEGELLYSDEVIEQIAKRVIKKISTKTIEEIAWEVIPDMAERYIKKAIDDIKKS